MKREGRQKKEGKRNMRVGGKRGEDSPGESRDKAE